MSEHTKGEWGIHSMSDSEPWPIEDGKTPPFDSMTIRIGVGDKIVGTATLTNPHDGQDYGHPSVRDADECRANAALMMAAPKLLVACVGAAAVLSAEGFSDSRAIMETLRAAIAKAATTAATEPVAG